MSRLIAISNRVAVPKARGVAGSQGGLAGAIFAALKETGGLWFGWSGEEADNPSPNPTLQDVGGVTMATIDLAPQDIVEYYDGYANSTLWPLFHYRLDLTVYERDTGRGYERVNELFAESVAPLIEPDDLVWVHDYHLMPLGNLLRERGIGNRIGFFLHVPWPPTRLLESLPYHRRLVRSLLDYDLIGFQCEEWLGSFLHYCETELSAEIDEDTGRIVIDGRSVVARTFPIGIDYDHVIEQAATPQAAEACERVRTSINRRTAMIGVDRLDYSKGLPERLSGIERFFERYPEQVRDLVFIQIAPPSRETLDSYQAIRAELEQKTGMINGAHSRIDMVPIRYVNKGHTLAELCGVYRASKIGLVTPLRDGMNLVAKEYVAAQDPDDPGVLILSRFAGAAEQLSDAILVNPHSPDDIASAIRDALVMPLPERKRRWNRLHACVRDENVHKWTKDFLDDLGGPES